MKEGIWGDPSKNSNTWSYKSDKSNKVVSPVNGDYEVGRNTDDDWAIIQFSEGQCNFTIKIGPLKNHINVGSVTENQIIGEAKNDTISLKVFKGLNQIDARLFFDKKDDCFKEKEKKEEKKEKSKELDQNPYQKKSTQIASADDFDFIYKNAAFPAYAILNPIRMVKEDIERIKQLMK